MRMIKVIAPAGHLETVESLAESKCIDHWTEAPMSDGRQVIHLLVTANESQKLLDGLQTFLGLEANARIIITDVEATLPAVDESADKGAKSRSNPSSREELLAEVEKNSRSSLNFLVLVFLSTIVAAVGLIKNNVAVVIGAMVIAPLLGPNLALSLGTALGDRKLMWKSMKTNMIGLILTLFLSVLIGLIWPISQPSQELLSRTVVGMDAVALALASGAAAALSLTTGLSSVLVGVMVAVALMPPAVTLGLMLANGNFELAGGALLLLAVNVVCLNLAANLVFYARGIGPRTWTEKKQAFHTMVASIAFWILLLVTLTAIILFR